jgi:hypothetical protein
VSFPTTMNVLKMDIGIALPLDILVILSLEQVKNIADSTVPLTHRRVTLSTIEAEEVKYGTKVAISTGEPVLIMLTQYLIVDGTTEYAVTFGTPPELSDKYSPTFEKIGQSFRLLK